MAAQAANAINAIKAINASTKTNKVASQKRASAKSKVKANVTKANVTKAMQTVGQLVIMGRIRNVILQNGVKWVRYQNELVKLADLKKMDAEDKHNKINKKVTAKAKTASAKKRVEKPIQQIKQIKQIESKTHSSKLTYSSGKPFDASRDLDHEYYDYKLKYNGKTLDFDASEILSATGLADTTTGQMVGIYYSEKQDIFIVVLDVAIRNGTKIKGTKGGFMGVIVSKPDGQTMDRATLYNKGKLWQDLYKLHTIFKNKYPGLLTVADF